ncbi:MAG: YvcK family protein [bacterium]|nr:YvcK family protein [bacterium]
MKAKKVVVLGGGTGMSTLLKGLKQYPLDITAIVSVCDDGKSTGILRKEFNTPAVGDIRRVLISLSETEPLFEELLNYRFNTNSQLNGHPVGNLLLTAMTNITGNMSDGIEALSKVLNLRGKVLPLTEYNVTLMGLMEDGTIVEGEHNITKFNKKIENVYYKETPVANPDAIKAITDADLIVLSMGSLFTSIIPNLICPNIVKAIDKSKANVLYACNIMTQPGESDDFKLSDHVNLLNSYLGEKKLSTVIANKGTISEEMMRIYETLEQKDPVIIDEENINEDTVLITDDLVEVVDKTLRHNVIKLAYHIFSTFYR